MSGSNQDNFVEFSPGKAWHSYPPKKILLPSDDFIEGEAFGVSGVVQASPGPPPTEVSAFGVSGILQNEIGRPPFAFQAAGGKNKTRKDKRKKYKTKKKIETIKQKIKKISKELR
jgi:hypothetical protein